MTVLRLGEIEVDLGLYEVRRPDGRENLTATEARLLGYLAERIGTAVSRDDLQREVWGYSPKVVSRAVHHAVTRLRRKIERDPREPAWLQTVHGVGYRLALGGRRDRPPRAAAPGGVPADGAPVFGGVAAVDHALAALAPERLVSLVGPAGVGKTRVAIRVAGRRQRSGAVHWVAAEGVSDRHELLRRLGAALGVAATADPLERVVEAVAARRGELIVIDGVDAVGEAITEVADRGRADGACLLVTSRGPVGGQAERTVEVAALGADDAVALFADRAGRVRAGWVPLPEEQDALRELVVEHLGGVPLAIELAAARMDLLGVEELAERLAARPLEGREGARLRAAIGASWALLDEVERTALARCSVFAGGFDLAAAEAVIDLRNDDALVLDVLRSLRRLALLEVDTVDDGRLRLNLLPAVRAFAAEQLAASHDADEVRQRHLVWFSELGIDDDEADRDPTLARRWERERANLGAAIHEARRRGDGPRLGACLLGLWSMVERRGSLAGWLELAEPVDIASLEPAQRPRLATCRSVALRLLSRVPEAIAEAEAAARDALEQGLASVASKALGAEATARMIVGDNDAAEALFRSAVDRAHAAGDRGAEATALGNLAVLHHRHGALEPAREAAEAALRLHRQTRCRRREGPVLNTLGLVFWRLGHTERALDQFEEALAILIEAEDRAAESVTRSNLALMLQELGAADAAFVEYDRAIATARELGLARSLGLTLGNLAISLLEQGRIEEAHRRTEEAIAIHQANGDDRMVAVGIGIRGDLARARCDLDEARRWYVQAQEMFRTAGDRTYEGHGLLRIGELEIEAGRFEEAAVALGASLALGHGPATEALVRAALAELEPDPEAALREVARAEALVERTGTEIERTVVRARRVRVLTRLGRGAEAARLRRSLAELADGVLEPTVRRLVDPVLRA